MSDTAKRQSERRRRKEETTTSPFNQSYLFYHSLSLSLPPSFNAKNTQNEREERGGVRSEKGEKGVKRKIETKNLYLSKVMEEASWDCLVNTE